MVGYMLEYKLDLRPGSYHYTTVLNYFAESFPFCCVTVGEYIMGDQYFTKREGLDNYLLILTTSGCEKMIYKGQNCFLKKNSAVLIDCNDYQEYFTAAGEEWHFYYLHFKAVSLKGYDVLINTLMPIILQSPDVCCELMKQLYKRAPSMDLLSYAAQSNTISHLLTEMIYSLAATENNRLVEPGVNMAKLAEYIRNHCVEPLHLEDFSKFTNVSKHHLIRVFQNIYGVAPYKYMHLCRIHLAQNYLLNTNMTIAEIAQEVGYHDTVLFMRHFKAVNCISPGQYRKNPNRLHV